MTFRGSTILLLPLLSAGLLLVAQTGFAEEPSQQQPDGQKIAEELRITAPTQNSEIRAVLKVRSAKQEITNNVAVVCKVIVRPDHWESIYETIPTPKMAAEQLVVRHFPDKPNEYLYARASAPRTPVPKPETLKAEDAHFPFAESDFSLVDLGLDFLHWPVQRRLADDKKLDRSCYVLESAKPAGPITHLKSWIDKESVEKGSPGILVAEAYDAKDKLVKKFSLGGTSFRKVNGQWQVQRMEIYDYTRSSRTTLEFDRPQDNLGPGSQP